MRRSATRRLAVLAAASALAAASGFGVAYAGNFVEENGSDFDCDGIRDLVVGEGWQTINGHQDAGSITIRYSTGATQTISQESLGVPGSAEPGDEFGDAHTSYDSDADGCDDLVVGAPYEDIGSAEDAGMVWLIPGSPTGLKTAVSVGYTQNSHAYPGVAEALDWFGYSLAAGATSQGDPYLLIGSPGESGASAETQQAGSVYYVRSGNVSAFSQATPGVPGKRQTGDHFGEKLATSDRYFVVGTPQETLYGDRLADPPVGRYGMVHVFSHALTSGRPTPIAGITQDTSGVSGTAEDFDQFGSAVSVVPYRPSNTSAIGALVAVGSFSERLGTRRQAGMAHLLHVSPSGAVRQVAAITQDTPGVTGTPEDGDRLGDEVVVANLNVAGTVATPQTASWAVAVSWEETANSNIGVVHVFPPAWQPGDRDIWVEDGTFGMPDGSLSHVFRLRASSSNLHIQSHFRGCLQVPWPNLLDGESRPVPRWDDDCR